MSLRSVVKSEVKWPDSDEHNKCKKKRRKAEQEDSSGERSRIRERGDAAKEPPEKMKRKHSEERNESEENDDSVDSVRKVQKHNRRASYESEERYSSEDQRKEAKKDRKREDRDQKKFRSDDSHEDSQEKKSSQRQYDERSRRDDDRSHRDYDWSRQDNKRSHRDDDRSRQRDERSNRVDRSSRKDEDRSKRDGDQSRMDDDRSCKDDDRSGRDYKRSGKDDDRSRRDDGRSHRDEDRSERDDDRSHRNGNRSRQDYDRLRRDDDQLRRRDDERSHRYNDQSTRSEPDHHRQNRHSESPKSDRKDKKSVDASDSKDVNEGDKAENYLAAKRTKPSTDGDLMTRTGGAYIPPARLRMMQAQITDKASAQYQRIAWEALKKSINGLINKINVSNIGMIVLELLQENIVRGRGLLARSIMQAQAASPTFTHVYAALVAIINTKFPNIGELIVKRLILTFKKGFRRNEKVTCLSSLRFIAHLFNQLVCHEVVALQVLMLLVSQPTDDSVEVAVGFLKECGKKLKELSPKSLNAVFESLRTVLHEAQIDKRVQYMIEVMFAIRKDGFKDHPSLIEGLDLVEEEDQYTHVLKLDDPDLDPEDGLNVFKFDPQYLENEEKYKAIKREHLDEGDSEDGDEDESGEGDGEDEEDDDDEDGGDGEGKEKTVIIDNTETNLVAFRRTLYLTIQSSLDFEECAHKIRKMEIKPGQEEELCNMILDCCAQQRTYEKFFGLLAQRFCMMEKKFMEPYQKIFQEQYETVHRLETNKLRNVAKFFSHLLHTDAIEWKVLECIRLNEDDTTSSGRIFIKILFQELSEFMGLSKLNDRLKDVTLQLHFEGLFPRDNPRNTRFAINFFTSIGLGGLTDELRDHLKNVPKQPNKSPTPVESSSSESSSSSKDDSDASSSDSSSASSSSSESKPSPAKKRRRVKPSETPEKFRKSGDGRKSKHLHKSGESLVPGKSSHKSEGPTSMQLRLMKLASYGQIPKDKALERDKVKVRGRDEDTRGRDRGQETHPSRNEDRQGHRRGQESDSESEKEQRKSNRKLDEDRRRSYEDNEKGRKEKKSHEEDKKGHKDKRTNEEDSESNQGRKHRSKRDNEDSTSDNERERRGPRNNSEDRGRERSRDKSREKRRRRSRS